MATRARVVHVYAQVAKRSEEAHVCKVALGSLFLFTAQTRAVTQNVLCTFDGRDIL